MTTWRERRLMKRLVRDYEQGRSKTHIGRDAKMIKSLINRGYVSGTAFAQVGESVVPEAWNG